MARLSDTTIYGDLVVSGKIQSSDDLVLSGTIDANQIYVNGVRKDTVWDSKQDNLVSGTNIKTVNSNSLLVSGNVAVGTVTAVNNGNGMNFTNITGSGTITLGTPSTLTASTSNGVTTSSHTHAITGFLPLTGGTLTGTLTVPNIAINGTGTDVLNFSATTTSDNRGISFNNRTALSSDSSDGWLRINQDSEFSNGIYTPGSMRIDGTLRFDASGTTVNEFSTDGTLAGNSDNAVPTEKAVRTYVDNNAGGGWELIEELTGTGTTATFTTFTAKNYFE
jgi:hypothetical protein